MCNNGNFKWVLLLLTFVSGICALPSTVLLILVDSFYFGYLTWNEILEWKISLENNFVVTPFNFIQYNAYTSNLANHGLHPRITHLLLNVPLLYNVLGIAAIYAFLSLLYRYVNLILLLTVNSTLILHSYLEK